MSRIGSYQLGQCLLRVFSFDGRSEIGPHKLLIIVESLFQGQILFFADGFRPASSAGQIGIIHEILVR